MASIAKFALFVFGSTTDTEGKHALRAYFFSFRDFSPVPPPAQWGKHLTETRLSRKWLSYLSYSVQQQELPVEKKKLWESDAKCLKNCFGRPRRRALAFSVLRICPIFGSVLTLINCVFRFWCFVWFVGFLQLVFRFRFLSTITLVFRIFMSNAPLLLVLPRKLHSGCAKTIIIPRASCI